jgi:hypothetical protein
VSYLKRVVSSAGVQKLDVIKIGFKYSDWFRFFSGQRRCLLSINGYVAEAHNRKMP